MERPDFILASEARARLHKLAESRAEWNRTRYRRQDTENVDFTDRLDPWIHHVYPKQEPGNGIDRTRPKIDLTLDPQVRRERCGYSSVDRSAEGAVAVYDGLRREIERFDIIFGALNSAADRVESLLKRPAKIAAWDSHATMNVVVDSNHRLVETTVRVKSPALTMAAGTLLHQLIDRSGEMRDVLRQLAPSGHLAADQARRSLYETAEALTTAFRLLLSNLHLAPLTESRMKSSSRYEGLQPHNATEWSEVLAAHDWHRLEKLAPALRMKVAELTGRLPEVWVARLPITASLRELTFVESEIHGMLDFLRSPHVASEESELSVITNRRAFSSKHALLRTKDVRTSSLCESDEEERPRF